MKHALRNPAAEKSEHSSDKVEYQCSNLEHALRDPGTNKVEHSPDRAIAAHLHVMATRQAIENAAATRCAQNAATVSATAFETQQVSQQHALQNRQNMDKHCFSVHQQLEAQQFLSSMQQKCEIDRHQCQAYSEQMHAQDLHQNARQSQILQEQNRSMGPVPTSEELKRCRSKVEVRNLLRHLKELKQSQRHFRDLTVLQQGTQRMLSLCSIAPEVSRCSSVLNNSPF